MWWLVRLAVAIIVLPCTVTVLIPVWIVHSQDTPPGLPSSPAGWAAAVAGFLVLCAGAGLFLACVARFATVGRGTLAPWDPPRELVVDGPYAHSRNPMISGVILLLLGEALLLRSPPHLAWAGVFFLINATYIPLLEEPLLRARFGERYEAYARHVPRLIPRLRPWRGVSAPNARSRDRVDER